MKELSKVGWSSEYQTDRWITAMSARTTMVNRDLPTDFKQTLNSQDWPLRCKRSKQTCFECIMSSWEGVWVFPHIKIDSWVEPLFLHNEQPVEMLRTCSRDTSLWKWSYPDQSIVGELHHVSYPVWNCLEISHWERQVDVRLFCRHVHLDRWKTMSGLYLPQCVYLVREGWVAVFLVIHADKTFFT